MEAGEPS